MSTTLIPELFRTQMDGLGYEEWDDALNVENIPSTIIDGAYHVEIPSGEMTVINQHVLNEASTVNLRVFKKGFANTLTMRDEMLAERQTILCDILSPAVRLSSGIKNIVADSWSITPLSDSNDNSAILEINFTCITVLQGFN